MAKALVDAANENWGKMVREGNAEGLAALYTEDTQVLPSGTPTMTGRAAFQKFVADGVLPNIKNAKLVCALLDDKADSVLSGPDGGTFWERGNYTFFADKEGTQVADTGKYVVIWKKVSAGNIQLYIDIFNSVK